MTKTKLSDYGKERLIWLKTKESLIKKHTECPEVFDKLSIYWDGKVTACCSVYDNKMVIGDILINSVQQIWNSDKLNHYMELLVNMRHEEMICYRTCYDTMSPRIPRLQGL